MYVTSEENTIFLRKYKRDYTKIYSKWSMWKTLQSLDLIYSIGTYNLSSFVIPNHFANHSLV